MLMFPLKKQWYDKIKSGEKTVEYREVKPFWDKRFWKNGYPVFIDKPYESDDESNVFKKMCEPAECVFQLGYNPKTRLKAFIKKIEVINGKDTDLKIDKPVYAIHFQLIDV